MIYYPQLSLNCWRHGHSVTGARESLIHRCSPRVKPPIYLSWYDVGWNGKGLLFEEFIPLCRLSIHTLLEAKRLAVDTYINHEIQAVSGPLDLHGNTLRVYSNIIIFSRRMPAKKKNDLLYTCIGLIYIDLRTSITNIFINADIPEICRPPPLMIMPVVWSCAAVGVFMCSLSILQPPSSPLKQIDPISLSPSIKAVFVYSSSHFTTRSICYVGWNAQAGYIGVVLKCSETKRHFLGVVIVTDHDMTL